MFTAEGVAALEVRAGMMWKSERVYPTLFYDDQGAMLVDTAYPGLEREIVAELERHGVGLDRLRAILLTHQDVDHSGAAPALARMAGGRVAIIAHRDEKPYVQGEERMRKFTSEGIDRIVESLPSAMPEAKRAAFRSVLEKPPLFAVDRTVVDGEEIAGYGVTVIGTPGHSPGHVCLYHRSSRTLVAGDSLLYHGGELFRPLRWTCEDPEMAEASFAKLARYDISTVVCYHGGVCSDTSATAIAALAAPS